MTDEATEAAYDALVKRESYSGCPTIEGVRAAIAAFLRAEASRIYRGNMLVHGDYIALWCETTADELTSTPSPRAMARDSGDRDER